MNFKVYENVLKTKSRVSVSKLCKVMAVLAKQIQELHVD